MRGNSVQVQVPKEESIAEIRDRYMDINSHAASYNWKALKSNPGSDQVPFSDTSLLLHVMWHVKHQYSSSFENLFCAVLTVSDQYPCA